jgi:elongation factor G
MDRTGADFYRVIKMIEERLHARAVPVQLPIGAEERFVGVVDLVSLRALVWDEETLGARYHEEEVPEDLQVLAREYREKLVEAVAEVDDTLLERYLDGQELNAVELRRAIRVAMLRFRIVPVFCGAAFRSKGIQPLLDGVVDYLPSPLDIPAVQGINPHGRQEEKRLADDQAPFAALAFKIMNDPFVGTLTYIRVYSGVATSGATVYNATKERKERLGRLLKMHANKREEVKAVYAGDIVAVVGLKNTTTGDTLCDGRHPIVLEAIEFPEPVISVAVEPKTRADQEKLGISLQKLAAEDPSFRVHTDRETGQTIVSGMGELHLEIIVDRLLREFNVGANVGKPRVAYRETICGSVEAEGKFVRQTGGRGQYGHVWLRVEPLPMGKGFEFVDATKGGVIPREFIPNVEKGAQEASEVGVLAGYPMVDIQVTLLDGSYHEVDSSEIAFKIAASQAFKKAAVKAKPVMLEPVMAVEVVLQEEFMGEVIGDLSGRRGKILGIESRGATRVISAQVPLAEMFGYATDLRSLTQGRAVHTMQFSHYEHVPTAVSEEMATRVTGL